MSFATTYFPAHIFLRSEIRHSLIKFLFGGGIRCSLIRSNQKFLTKVFPPRVFEQSLFLFSSPNGDSDFAQSEKVERRERMSRFLASPRLLRRGICRKRTSSVSSSVVAKRQKTILGLGPYITTAHSKSKDTSKPPPPPAPSVATTYLKKP